MHTVANKDTLFKIPPSIDLGHREPRFLNFTFAVELMAHGVRLLGSSIALTLIGLLANV